MYTYGLNNIKKSTHKNRSIVAKREFFNFREFKFASERI